MILMNLNTSILKNEYTYTHKIYTYYVVYYELNMYKYKH